MAGVRAGDVAGVPAYWVETGRPTLSASLIFRRGLADETFATSGWTHLVEHLALADGDRGALQMNGHVGLLMCRLSADGPRDRVIEALTRTCRWLAYPELSHLQRELSVLRAESAARPHSPMRTALAQRYGAQGPGLADYDEPGLVRAEAAVLARMMREHFTNGNAALVLDGPPDGLVLELPDGCLRPLVRAAPVEDDLPVGYRVPDLPAVVSGAVTDHPDVLAAVLQELMHRRFRDAVGGAYAPWSIHERVDGSTFIVCCGSDANARLRAGLPAAMIDIVRCAAEGGLADRVVKDVIERYHQDLRDPYREMAFAHLAADDHLHGRPVRTTEERLAELASIDADAVAAAAQQLLGSLMVGIGPGSGWPSGLRALTRPAQSAQIAGSVRRARAPLDPSRLIITRDTVQLWDGDRGVSTRTDELVGMISYRDGRRDLIDRSGWATVIEPTLWSDGEGLAGSLDAMVPAELHLPRPRRRVDEIPLPLSLWANLRAIGQSLPTWRRDLIRVLGLIGLTVAWLGMLAAPFFGWNRLWLLCAAVGFGALVAGTYLFTDGDD